ncbi:MAG TPA: phytanoyl-CoA dioxygenase family protein [Flavitalea sp.]|nr:phytanoyl-CoA dioxygenase family protein [Flavitalea sp.]HTF32030.1 phytanoyl-CoA dioxygenase family protein [Flavitalea sp.]
MRKWISKYTGILRRLRITYWLFNLVNLSKLKNNKWRYKKFGIRKQVWESISHADIKNSSGDIPWMDKPGITTEQIKQHPLFSSFSGVIQNELLAWPGNGYMIIPKLFEKEADLINTEIENLLRDGKVVFNYTNRKIMDAWKQSELINEIFYNPEVLKIMSFLFDKEIAPFQTINFIYGSEQKPHSDSIHMTTEPLGYLAATWIALEDVEDGSGELIYYPGSHKLNYVMSEDYNTGNSFLKLGEKNYAHYEEKIESVIYQHNLHQNKFLPKKGDMLIWHANLLHGGSPITKPDKTRKSIVTHYFAKGVLCYHEISQRPAVIKA